MDPKLLRYYSQELQHLREMGGEFAREFPKIAGRLGLEEMECADPYVERLLEGFSLLAARLQLKIDAEFPRFTQHLAEIVYPQFLAPTPSMAVVQLQPDISNPTLARGLQVSRGSALRSTLAKGEATPCEYRTAQDVTLWPIELIEAKFFTQSGRQGGVDLPLPTGIKGGLRLRLRAGAGLAIKDLALDRLCLHIRGSDDLPMRIYEQLLAGVQGVLALPVTRPVEWHVLQPKTAFRSRGFDDDEALLPIDRRGFQGYRLVQEYFAFPQRYMFVELMNLQPAVRRCTDNEIELIVLLDRIDVQLEQVVDSGHFALHCTPAINLFKKRADRIAVSSQQYEFHVLPDRTRPLDFEVYQIGNVTGYGTENGKKQKFHPFYSAKDMATPHQSKAFYQVRREPRMASSRQAFKGSRSSYAGSEVFISLVDAGQAPYHDGLRQLGLDLLCTNRDLPLTMALGLGKTDFTLDSDAPVLSVRCMAGPSQPVPSFAEGNMTWRLLNHLSLNYLSLLDAEPEQGALGLREMLALYCPVGNLAMQRQIKGVRSIHCEKIIRRTPSPGPITFGRGLQLKLTFDEAGFHGGGVFLLGAVLERFFEQYVSINSFTETIVSTFSHGEIMRWPVRGGQCTIL